MHIPCTIPLDPPKQSIPYSVTKHGIYRKLYEKSAVKCQPHLNIPHNDLILYFNSDVDSSLQSQTQPPPPHLLFLHCTTFEGIFERNIPVVKSLATIVSHQMPTGIHLPTLIKHPGQIFDSKLKRII